MNRIEKLIPDAIQVIENLGIADADYKVAKEFKGYFSSFGAGIIQSGLLPAVIFFENEDSKSNEDRKKVPKAILQLLKNKEKLGLGKNEELLSEFIYNSRDRHQVARRIGDAAIALKIALRTFDLSS